MRSEKKRGEVMKPGSWLSDHYIFKHFWKPMLGWAMVGHCRSSKAYSVTIYIHGLMPVLLGVRSMSCGSGCELSNLVGSLARNCSLFQRFSTLLHGCFLKCGYPQNTPNWSFLVGKPIVVGYHHFRKPRISVPDADTYTL